MPDVIQIRERPPHLSVVALLEAEGLPTSDLTEAHLEHFFFTGTDGAPSALVGLEIYGNAALLRSLVVSAATTSRARQRQGPSCLDPLLCHLNRIRVRDRPLGSRALGKDSLAVNIGDLLPKSWRTADLG